jgi:hypothetical protein
MTKKTNSRLFLDYLHQEYGVGRPRMEMLDDGHDVPRHARCKT